MRYVDADKIGFPPAREVVSGVIKLCYCALCEYREYGDPGYLRVAARKLELDT